MCANLIKIQKYHKYNLEPAQRFQANANRELIKVLLSFQSKRHRVYKIIIIIHLKIIKYNQYDGTINNNKRCLCLDSIHCTFRSMWNPNKVNIISGSDTS